ncbi:myb-related transcription factor, partner of profilin [Plakobranchus ocellatus]|uniref:Myb-related transcription factor, partner of profilin n=1 Tax=Plakobranchus ocellatus TaxID=259542 RepID=A0AAV4A3M9_9GAST|nr:myb-related transcription factor, partner of profilin [Plakobranchus ocellatus]
MATSSKRVRKPNFSEKEATKLLELVDKNIETINQTASTLRANAVKKAAWQEIAKEVSATSLVHRDEDECRKKWRDLKRAVSAYRTHCRGTGGGQPQPEPPFYEWIFKNLRDSVALEGIPVNILDTWDNSVPLILPGDITIMDVNNGK